MNSRNIRAFVFFTLFYVVFGVILTWQQERLVYHPTGPEFGVCPYLQDAQTISYNKTRFYHYTHSETAPLAVLYHGNAGSACDRGRYLAPLLREAGYSYLFVEYEGYGDDSRAPSHDGLRRTVADTASYLSEHMNVPVTLIGESIGSGAVALHLKAHTPERLILITPLTTLSDVAAHQYWFYPTGLLVHDPFNVPAAVRNYEGTSLVLLAETDSIVPPDLGREVYDALGGEKELTVVENADHNNLMVTWPAQHAIETFLRRTYPNDTP